MPPFIDLTGRRVGRLVVLHRVRDRKNVVCWRCRCDCGKQRVIRANHLLHKHTESCGCWNSDSHATHGHAVHGNESAEYRAWHSMVNRCYVTSHTSFRYYGGRGITVCDAWRHDFAAFLAHIGPKPHRRHFLDRINNDGHYEPGNVRWVTPKESARNRRPAQAG